MSMLSRLLRTSRVLNRRSSAKFNRRGRFEHLESRVLLTVNTFNDGQLIIDDQASSVDRIVLRVNESGELLVGDDILSGVVPGDVTSLRVYGGSGDDHIDVSAVNPFSFPLLQDNAIAVFGGGGADVVYGSEFGDIIYGGAGDDTLYGLSGDDSIHGHGGIDEIHGGDGNDLLQAMSSSNAGLPNVMEDVASVENGVATISLSFDQDTFVDPSALVVTDENGAEIDLGGVSFSADPAGFKASWAFSSSAISGGSYGYSIIHDRVAGIDGYFLDGNSDGVAGDDFRGKLSANAIPALNGVEVHEFEVNAGLDDHSRLESISIQFGQDVQDSIDVGDLVLEASDGVSQVIPVGVAYDHLTNTSVWSFDSEAILSGYYVARLDGNGIQNSGGVSLSGDFLTGGTEYRRTVLVAVSGDLNLDGAVKGAEATAVIASVGAQGVGWLGGDITADGVVSPADASLVVGNLGSVMFDKSPPSASLTAEPELLHGGYGNDYFVFYSPKGAVTNEIYDIDGRDTISFSRMSHGGGIDIDLRSSLQPVIDGQKPADKLTVVLEQAAIENVIGTKFGDQIIGNERDNVVSGYKGDDHLRGEGGDDQLMGGVGNDTYVFAGSSDLGHDFVLEAPGAGDDVVDLSGLPGELSYSSHIRTQEVSSNLKLTTDDFEGEPAAIERVTPSVVSLITAGSITGVVNGESYLELATFADSLSGGLPEDYEAIIDWGDGQQSPAEIVKRDDGLFAVRGRHKFSATDSNNPHLLFRGRDNVWTETPLQIDVFNSVVFDDDGVIDNAAVGYMNLDLPNNGAYVRNIQDSRLDQNAVLSISRSSRTLSGQFQLVMNGQATEMLAWDASHLEVKDAMLAAFSEFAAGDLLVVGTSLGWEIEFVGAWASQTPPEIEVLDSIEASPRISGGYSEEFTTRLFPSSGISNLSGVQGSFSVELPGVGELNGPLEAFESPLSLQGLIDSQLGDLSDSRFEVTADGTGITIIEQLPPGANEFQSAQVAFDPPSCLGPALCAEWLTEITKIRKSNPTFTPTPEGNYSATLRFGDTHANHDSIYVPVGIHEFAGDLNALKSVIDSALDDELFIPEFQELYGGPWRYGTNVYWERNSLVFTSIGSVIYDSNGDLYGVAAPNIPSNPALPLESTFFGLAGDVDLIVQGDMGAEFERLGHHARNEIKSIRIPSWYSDNTFLLSYGNEVVEISVAADQSAMQVSLDALLGQGNSVAVQVILPNSLNAWEVEFVGALAEREVSLHSPQIQVDLMGAIDWNLNSNDTIWNTEANLDPAGPFWTSFDYDLAVTGSSPGPLPSTSSTHDISWSVGAQILDERSGQSRVFVGDVPEVSIVELFTPGRSSSIGLDEMGVTQSSNLVIGVSQEIESWHLDFGRNQLTWIADSSKHSDGRIEIGQFDDGQYSGLTRIELQLDSDGDGLTDVDELAGPTDPFEFDSDGDLLSDGFETLADSAAGLDPTLVNDAFADPDLDLLTNFTEQVYGTNPGLLDSDEDGYTDGYEVNEAYSDPNDANDPTPGGQNSQALGFNSDSSRFPLEINIGDHSGSHSERWQLNLGPISHVSPDFGELSGWVHYPAFREGESYDLSLLHQGTDPDYYDRNGRSDFDWHADVGVPEGGEGAIYVDETPIAGDSAHPLVGSTCCYAGVDLTLGNIAVVHIPKVDLDIVKQDGSEVEDDREEESNIVVAWNLDDDNNNRQADVLDSPNRREDDLLELRLRQVKPVGLKGDFTLSFDIGRINVWRSREKTGQVFPGVTTLDASEEHELYIEGAFTGSTEFNDIEISATFVPDAEEGYTVKGNEATDRVKIAIGTGNLTAHRPQVGNDGYEPFQKTRVEEIDETDPKKGPGIRVNKDSDQGVEDDLIEVVISRPPIHDLRVIVATDSLSSKLWYTPYGSGEIAFDPITQETDVIDFGAQNETTIWVELTDENTNFFELELKVKDQDAVLDTLTFHRFTSIVVILGGEDFPWNELPGVDENPYPTDGIWEYAKFAYENGYNTVMYDEDLIDTQGAGRAYDDIVNAVNHQFIDKVSINGYSHGGGSTYGLSWRLNQNVVGALADIMIPFTVPYTSYVDAITDWTAGSEQRRPLLTQFHTNQYQDTGFLQGDNMNPLSEDDIDRTYLGVNHTTIDNHPIVLQLMKSRLEQKVKR